MQGSIFLAAAIGSFVRGACPGVDLGRAAVAVAVVHIAFRFEHHSAVRCLEHQAAFLAVNDPVMAYVCPICIHKLDAGCHARGGTPKAAGTLPCHAHPASTAEVAVLTGVPAG